MKRNIKLTESQFNKFIVETCKKVLNESADRFDDDAFEKWEEKEQIPQQTKNMVNFIAEKIGAGEVFSNGEEETIELTNRGGYTYAYGKGFSISHCTFSFADGPGIDYSEEFTKWLKGLGFKMVNSYGDNGMDPLGSNGRDTYWTHEYVYEPSIVYEEQFMIWGDPEYY